MLPIIIDAEDGTPSETDRENEIDVKFIIYAS